MSSSYVLAACYEPIENTNAEAKAKIESLFLCSINDNINSKAVRFKCTS